MAISLRAMGSVTAVTAAVTAVNPVVPAATVSGDLAVLTVSVKPYNSVITTPSGWTKIGEGTNGTVAQGQDVGSVKVAVYVRTNIAGGSGIGNIVTTSGDTMSAVIASYQKGAGETWDYALFTTGADTTHAANFSATGATGIDLAAGDFVFMGVAVNSDAGTPTSGVLTATGATIVMGSGTTGGVTTGWDSRVIVFDASAQARPTPPRPWSTRTPRRPQARCCSCASASPHLATPTRRRELSQSPPRHPVPW
jgi:hypothetical protein